MARVSRSLLLAVCSNKRFKLRAGDVTSAFLQASESVGDLGLTVWAPAELAVLFGASPLHPVMPLRVCRAFYGLFRVLVVGFKMCPQRFSSKDGNAFWQIVVFPVFMMTIPMTSSALQGCMWIVFWLVAKKSTQSLRPLSRPCRKPTSGANGNKMNLISLFVTLFSCKMVQFKSISSHMLKNGWMRLSCQSTELHNRNRLWPHVKYPCCEVPLGQLPGSLRREAHTSKQKQVFCFGDSKGHRQQHHQGQQADPRNQT